MSTLTQCKKEIRNMFFISVKNDLKTWKGSYPSYNSKDYSNDTNHSYFYVDSDITDTYTGGTVFLYYNNERKQKISRYAFWIVPLDFKVWWYVRKIKKHFKKIENDEKDISKIKIFKNGLNVFEKNFTKEVRKQKLDQINK